MINEELTKDDIDCLVSSMILLEKKGPEHLKKLMQMSEEDFIKYCKQQILKSYIEFTDHIIRCDKCDNELFKITSYSGSCVQYGKIGCPQCGSMQYFPRKNNQGDIDVFTKNKR